MSNIPTAAIIIIGNEILSGRTVDQNIPFLAKKLDTLGIKLTHVHIIADIADQIIETVRLCQKNVTYVFTTGGIGPTHDDITAQAIANAFNCPLELHPLALQVLQKYYGEKNVSPASRKMALIPKGANLIYNSVSGAPGFYLHNVFVMAGVPDIVHAMFDEVVTLLTQGPKIHSKTIQSSLGESLLAVELTSIQDRYPQVNIGSYPHFKNNSYGLSLVLRGTDQDAVLQATNEVVALIRKKGGNPIIEAS